MILFVEHKYLAEFIAVFSPLHSLDCSEISFQNRLKPFACIVVIRYHMDLRIEN